MTDETKRSNRRTFLAGAGSVMIAGVFAGCNSGSGSGNGSANGTAGGGSGTSLQSDTTTAGETTTEAGTAMETEPETGATTADEGTTAGKTDTEETTSGTGTDAEPTASETATETDAATATENGTTATETEMDTESDNESDEDGSERDRNRLTFGEIRQEPPSELDSLNQEYVELINASGSPNDLSGYTITYGDGAEYTFDDGFELGVGDRVLVHTGSGDDSDTDVYVGRDSVALDYQGQDDVRVTDPSGNVVLEATA